MLRLNPIKTSHCKKKDFDPRCNDSVSELGSRLVTSSISQDCQYISIPLGINGLMSYMIIDIKQLIGLSIPV